MNMEMIRLETFNHFPKSGSVSTLRLAKDGFYYSGRDDMVICFSCGVQRGGWEPFDNPRDIHKQISPNCKLFNSSESQNIEIGRENSTETQTVGGNFDQTNQTEIPQQQISFEDVQGSLTNAEFQTQETINTEPYETTNGTQQSGVVVNRNIKIGNRTRALQEKINTYLRNLDPLGINFDRPKYPEYAVLAVRESSYEDWPSTLTQTPQSLAKSGFMYMGYGDYTRCFFCGGGLRNWEPGDDPWTEHARWFPKCAFLRQNKGDEFVALVQIENQDAASHENEESTAEQRCEITTLQRNVTQNSGNAAMFDFPSVQSVLEMGYSHESVEEAFDLLKISQDSEEISGEELLEVILAKEEDLEETGTPSSRRTIISSLSGRILPGHKISRAANNLPEPNADTLSGMAKLDTNYLMEENRQLRDLMICKICLENEASIAMLPCGHLCCCTDCAPAMRKCPICRQFVKGTVRTWLI